MILDLSFSFLNSYFYSFSKILIYIYLYTTNIFVYLKILYYLLYYTYPQQNIHTWHVCIYENILIRFFSFEHNYEERFSRLEYYYIIVSTQLISKQHNRWQILAIIKGEWNLIRIEILDKINHAQTFFFALMKGNKMLVRPSLSGSQNVIFLKYVVGIIKPFIGWNKMTVDCKSHKYLMIIVKN